MSIRYPRETPLPGVIAAGLGVAGAVVATIVAVSIGGTHHPDLALLLLVAVAGTVAFTTTWTVGLAIAAVCWAFDSGFVLGREATLTFTATSGLAAVAIVGAAIFASAVGHTQRGLRGLDRA